MKYYDPNMPKKECLSSHDTMSMVCIFAEQPEIQEPEGNRNREKECFFMLSSPSPTIVKDLSPGNNALTAEPFSTSVNLVKIMPCRHPLGSGLYEVDY